MAGLRGAPARQVSSGEPGESVKVEVARADAVPEVAAVAFDDFGPRAEARTYGVRVAPFGPAVDTDDAALEERLGGGVAGHAAKV